MLVWLDNQAKYHLSIMINKHDIYCRLNMCRRLFVLAACCCVLHMLFCLVNIIMTAVYVCLCACVLYHDAGIT